MLAKVETNQAVEQNLECTQTFMCVKGLPHVLQSRDVEAEVEEQQGHRG